MTGACSGLPHSAQSTVFYTPNCTHIPDGGPCVNDSSIEDACNVCTEKDPCLFDLIADPSERRNIAAANTEIVKRMSSQLATYSAYTDQSMNATQLANYDCVTDIRPWWGDFAGPCCRPKQA